MQNSGLIHIALLGHLVVPLRLVTLVSERLLVTLRSTYHDGDVPAQAVVVLLHGALTAHLPALVTVLVRLLVRKLVVWLHCRR